MSSDEADISARLGITHRAGCTAPTWVAGMPLSTMMGRNPAIHLVADGNGGELFRCTMCGMVEGQTPDATTVAVPGPRPTIDVTRKQIEVERARRIRDGEPYGADKLADHFNCHESTIRRRLGLIP